MLIGIDGLHDSILSDLVLRYSPQYYHFVANATNVVFNNIDIAGGSTSNNLAKNTDGWDTYRSKDVTIMNSVINNGDGEFPSLIHCISTDTIHMAGVGYCSCYAFVSLRSRVTAD